MVVYGAGSPWQLGPKRIAVTADASSSFASVTAPEAGLERSIWRCFSGDFNGIPGVQQPKMRLSLWKMVKHGDFIIKIVILPADNGRMIVKIVISPVDNGRMIWMNYNDRTLRPH